MVATTPLQVLVCDDDADMRAWLCHILRHVTTDIACASTGRELLEALADGRYDLVITDVRMPAPSGLQVVSMARTAGLATPVLIITGFTDRSHEAAADRMSHVAVLAKPFTGDELLHALRGLISS
jgi:DNA-binding response OmpR family regulator